MELLYELESKADEFIVERMRRTIADALPEDVRAAGAGTVNDGEYRAPEVVGVGAAWLDGFASVGVGKWGEVGHCAVEVVFH